MDDGRVVSNVCVVRQSSGGSCLEYVEEPDWIYSKMRRIREGWSSPSYIVRAALTVSEMESRAVQMTDLTASPLQSSDKGPLGDGCACPFGLSCGGDNELASYLHESIFSKDFERCPSKTESVSLSGRESRRCNVRRVAQVLCR